MRSRSSGDESIEEVESESESDSESAMEEDTDLSESEGGKSESLFESGSEAEGEREAGDRDPDPDPVSESEDGSIDVDESESPPDLYHSLLYSQRIKSFEEGGWPIVKTGSLVDKCTPHELAMAGLEFAAQGVAKCVICYRPVTGLTRNSDPWEAHQRTYSKCPLIKLGKPTRPDGYTLQNFFKLIGEKEALYLEYQLLLFEDQVKGMLKGLVDKENEEQKENEC